jgi:hypothetical protein
MTFLSSLADQINNQFSIGENTNHTLNSVNQDGKTIAYGSLGDSAQLIDKTAERRYTEEGYLRKDPYNVVPKQFEILTQQPNATILVKKRMFSSIAENFRPDFMDEDEKLYYKSIRVLFQNKCNQISALEKLSKIEKITSASGQIDNILIPLIISLTDTINDGMEKGSNLFNTFGSSSALNKEAASSFIKTVDVLRRIYAFNSTNQYTTWLTDSTNLIESTFGKGTGVIEITNFASLNTNTTTSISSPGSASFNIIDPYELMVITEFDIEKAIADSTNVFYNSKLYQFGKDNANKLISDLKVRLNKYRADRGASPISFKVNPDTMLGKRVVAIIDRQGIELPFVYDSSSAAGILSGGVFGSGVSVSPEYLRDGAIAGFDGLDAQKKSFSTLDKTGTHVGPDSELSLFSRLVKTIFGQLSLEANSINTFQFSNQKTNFTRRKLRFNFLGKLIIQPQDTLHIYISSKSKYDNRLMTGINNMMTGIGFLQGIDAAYTGIKDSIGSLLNPNNDINFQAEKCAFVGYDFPNRLWSMMRSQFVTENEGTHVFGGIIQSAKSSWSDGRFSVSISATDNSAYLEMGKINFKPGVDTYNGAVFDPLTPFKTRFDTISSNVKDNTPQLLEENKALLSAAHPFIKYKSGASASSVASEKGIFQDKSVDPLSGRLIRTFYAPDGLVYKWKEGIGVFVQFGSSLDFNNVKRVGAPNIAKDPFAGQDVMNVISLSITGQPYNYATYLRASQEQDGACKDPQSQQNAAHSYIESLRSSLTKNNTLWGNFIPFKNLTFDEQSYANNLNTQNNITQLDSRISENLQKLAELRSKATNFNIRNVFNQNLFQDSKIMDKDVQIVGGEIARLNSEIQKDIDQLRKEDRTLATNINNDTSKGANSVDDLSKPNEIGNSNTRRLIRRKLNFLSRRMSYNVRANDDKNLFIVDDYYDKDYDLMAFNKALTDGIKLYSNEYTTVKENIINAASLLNLEVYCDTQGHLRVRPPQYNRMPSSVFYKMMYMKQSLGIQVFPQFLDDMFSDQLKSLKDKIEIIEDQIRLDCAVLGINTDAQAEFFIVHSNNNVNAVGDGFVFISNQDGMIINVNELIRNANPDKRDSVNKQSKDVYNNIEGQVKSTRNLISNADRYMMLKTSFSDNKLVGAGYGITDSSSFDSNSRVQELINRIQTKSGQRIIRDEYIIKSDQASLDLMRTIDIFKVLGELSSKISERAAALKLFYSTLRNCLEFKSLDSDGSMTSKLMMPGIFANSNIPEIFEHMIEDESYDDYGQDSGQRYVIKRSQIKSISIWEEKPPFTCVDVRGVMNPYAPEALPAGLQTFPGGGNAMTTAMAVDYDMWRNYGFISQNSINVPFLTDPNSQCAPYATMILSRARKEILKGNVTIVGNEYMQPGEVVFIEDRNLLFYVSSVSHSFTFGSQFQTTLELTYGHAPGEYIPTTVDVIGKMIYNNKDVASYDIQRQSGTESESNLGILLKKQDSSKVIDDGDDNSKPNNDYMKSNSQTITNILYTASAYIRQNNTQGNNIRAKLELRIYFDENNKLDDNLQKFAELARQSFVDQNQAPKTKSYDNKKTTAPPLINDPEVVKIVQINLSTMGQSPSQKAIDAARNMISTNTTTSNAGASLPNNNDGGTGVKGNEGKSIPVVNKDKIRTMLMRYIVDCWISFEEITPPPTE